MKWGIILSSIFLIGLISVIYFFPSGKIDFAPSSENTNFSITNNSPMQFYSNLRFADTNISYEISNCTLKKQNDMESAFAIIENITPLNFYSVNSEGNIFVTCDEKIKPSEGGLFIAGEGGPSMIIGAGNFNVILEGKILLIKNSNCANPNVAIHELLHVLGFEHSENSENVMYNITNCNQVIGDDVISLLNELYSIPSYPDLILENVSASKEGTFINVNFTVLNYGLNTSGNFMIKIYSGDSVLKEMEIELIEIGKGRIISVQNIFTIKQIDELDVVIESDFDEIDEENNKIKLEIKS
ncbi:matrixin family metalloprotease [Candidatus Pacearchaeota archaeon]|jgi:hypothetical protein|nr:matrixin family metalloprotease [Candidatus Pacearchaeota archaeon]